MKKKLFKSSKNTPVYHCHKVIELKRDGSCVMVKDTSTGLTGQKVVDINNYLDSDERVCLKKELSKEEKDQMFKNRELPEYEFNFDAEKFFNQIKQKR